MTDDLSTMMRDLPSVCCDLCDPSPQKPLENKYSKNTKNSIMYMLCSMNVCIRVESLIIICYLPLPTERKLMYSCSFGGLGCVHVSVGLVFFVLFS